MRRLRLRGQLIDPLGVKTRPVRAIWGNNNWDLEVAEFLDLCEGLWVFVYSLLNVLHPLAFKSSLREAAGLALILGKNGDQLRFLSEGETTKPPKRIAPGVKPRYRSLLS